MPLLFLKTQTVQTQVDKETMILLRKRVIFSSTKVVNRIPNP